MTIQAIERAVDILSLFSLSRPSLGIKEISQALDLAQPTVHGIVKTLCRRGLLVQDLETRKYALGHKVQELGQIHSGTLKINRIGSGPAHWLCRKTRLVVRLSSWDGEVMLVTFNVFPNAEYAQFHQMGPRIPAYASASGKAVLAWMPAADLSAYLERVRLAPYTDHTLTSKKRLVDDLKETRRRGFALDHEEHVWGIACAAAPILDASGLPTAAISISGSPEFLTDGSLATRTVDLKAAARDISNQLGYSPEAHPDAREIRAGR